MPAGIGPLVPADEFLNHQMLRFWPEVDPAITLSRSRPYQKNDSRFVEQKNSTLAKPELFDMTVDAGESFNVAERHPEIVKELQARIAAALKTFPEEIQQANTELIQP